LFFACSSSPAPIGDHLSHAAIVSLGRGVTNFIFPFHFHIVFVFVLLPLFFKLKFNGYSLNRRHQRPLVIFFDFAIDSSCL